MKVRRALGLYAFFYASLHFLIFVGVDYGFDPELLKEAIFEKRFALVGFSAFLILLPLAITSTRWLEEAIREVLVPAAQTGVSGWPARDRPLHLAGQIRYPHPDPVRAGRCDLADPAHSSHPAFLWETLCSQSSQSIWKVSAP